jgi:hypothetical protein
MYVKILKQRSLVCLLVFYEMWETDHLPWCKEMGYKPGTFEEFERQLRRQVGEGDLQDTFTMKNNCDVCGSLSILIVNGIHICEYSKR